jgi:hypothetical protein
MAKEHSCKCASCTASAKQATLRERERIIALLETLIVDSEGYFNIDEAIAAIKGEN